MTSDAARKRELSGIIAAAADLVLSHQLSLADAVAMAAAFQAGGNTPSEPAREAIAAARRSRKQEMMREYRRLAGAGRARNAASIVARRFATDPLDLLEVAALADKVRRWARCEKSRH